MRPYEKNPKAIYAESFATVAREADLKRFHMAWTSWLRALFTPVVWLI